MNKTNYPKEAGIITGYHHEYYGNPTGYGFYRGWLEQCRKMNPSMKQDSCVSYDIEPLMEYETLAFFPAKVLEIIDVFDSLTDPNRKYKKSLTTEEAISLMEEEFVNSNHKLDIILFDIFKRFVSEMPAA